MAAAPMQSPPLPSVESAGEMVTVPRSQYDTLVETSEGNVQMAYLEAMSRSRFHIFLMFWGFPLLVF